jgi:hypothetical protein
LSRAIFQSAAPSAYHWIFDLHFEMKHELFTDRIGSFVLFPVIHHSYEFALAARSAFFTVKPSAIAVEYPFLLQDLILQGVRRLPRVSVLVFGNKKKNYIRIEPVDPFVEAVRLAIDNNLQILCMDLSLTDYPLVSDPCPDTFSLVHLGHKKYCEMVLEKLFRIPVAEDEHRERAMAYYLIEFERKLAQGTPGAPVGPVLVLCGLSHLKGLRSQLSHQQPQPFEHRQNAKLYHLSSASLGEIMGTFPFLTSVYELQRSPARKETEVQVQSPAYFESAEQNKIQVIHGKSSESLESFVTRAQEETAFGSDGKRDDVLRHFLYHCRHYYEKEIGDRLSPQQFVMLENFSRKYANIKYMLLPDYFELLIAGRGCVNSHFCYRMWEIGTCYPAQHGPTELEVIELRAQDIFALVSKVRMNPYPPLKPRAALPKFLLQKQKKQRKPDQTWRFSPYTICSFQPEDLAIESYGNYLRTKGKSILSEERKRVHPFETSLLDGIDLRETIRNWHTGQIFVQECISVKGEVSSLVVVFDEDHKKYPYTLTWLGEHHQESDMAFYATDPDDRQAGPGIRKAIYGGFLMTIPPGRLYDVFGDPAYAMAANYGERLLLAGIDYGVEKFVVYAASKPPRPMFQWIAGRYGKRILYIPLSQLSPVALQKIRSFHILSDKTVRDYAKDYIW